MTFIGRITSTFRTNNDFFHVIILYVYFELILLHWYRAWNWSFFTALISEFMPIWILIWNFFFWPDRNATSYGTLGRRPPPSHMVPDLYSPASEPPLSVNRYNTYNPSQGLGSHHHPQIHGHHQQNGTLHRTQAPKLQFPKDYIRNGSMSAMNIPMSPNNPSGSPPNMDQPHYPSHGLPQPGSPTRIVPGSGMGQPMLTTFSGEHTVPTTTLPIEQRGHLVWAAEHSVLVLRCEQNILCVC